MKVEATHVQNVCRSQKPGGTCSFLMMGGDGWECAKDTPFESALRARSEKRVMNAMGDNCSGPPDFKPRS